MSGEQEEFPRFRHEPERPHRGWSDPRRGLIDGVARSSDLLVDITDTDGKVNRSVPLWEAIGDDQEEYEDKDRLASNRSRHLPRCHARARRRSR
jgi:hypothetical protein